MPWLSLSTSQKESFKRLRILRPVLQHFRKKRLAEWEAAGKPAPAPHLNKQRVLRDLGRKYGVRILIETGTYMGDMIEAMRTEFDRLYSIELSEDLHRSAVKRFQKYSHIEIIQGDSGTELKKLMERIGEPAIFWLDGHYQGALTALGEEVCPIFGELDPIFATWERGHVVVIDDARLFVEGTGYPLLQTVLDYVEQHRPDAVVEVVDDAIRILPALGA